MSYSFVGYAVVDQAPSSSITVDLSALTGGTRAANDVAYVVLTAGPSLNLGLVSWSSAGWSDHMGLLRNPGGAIGYVGRVFEKQLTGTETTVTFTDAGAQGNTWLAVAVVYRSLNPIALALVQDNDPTSSTTTTIPWTDFNPTDVTSTSPVTAHALGTTRQQLLYVYWGMSTNFLFVSGAIVRSATDSNLVERVAYRTTDASRTFFIAVFDELWASAANLPTRAVSTHWTVGTGTHHSFLTRRRPLIDQGIPPDTPVTPAEQDHWAWTTGNASQYDSFAPTYDDIHATYDAPEQTDSWGDDAR